jgi:hypothetical protein
MLKRVGETLKILGGHPKCSAFLTPCRDSRLHLCENGFRAPLKSGNTP